MTADIDHDLLNDALRRCGATWDAAQAHGLLSSQLAVAGAGIGPEWLGQVLDGADRSDTGRQECVALLSDLFDATRRTLLERMSEFSPLLPDDSDSPEVRIEALARWSEGYLHGLVSLQHTDALKARLAAEPLADIIKDMLQFTRAAAAAEEADEEAYVEIVEYLRVAAQLVYEELAEFRPETPREVH